MVVAKPFFFVAHERAIWCAHGSSKRFLAPESLANDTISTAVSLHRVRRVNRCSHTGSEGGSAKDLAKDILEEACPPTRLRLLPGIRWALNEPTRWNWWGEIGVTCSLPLTGIHYV